MTTRTVEIAQQFAHIFRCPKSKSDLHSSDATLKTINGQGVYPVTEDGIVLFAATPHTSDSQRQQEHYDNIASVYLETLSYPHTEEYWTYVNDALLNAIGSKPLGLMGEICCGGGEAIALLKDRADACIGIDISENMLHSARRSHPEPTIGFAQGDATNMPIKDNRFDHIVMLGGIHHVSDRPALFSEISRVLKPGGRFIWREPVSDFFLWRWLRSIIYRLSPYLDHETERPLIWHETVPVLEAAGFTVTSWKTYGFFGFCLFVNSDVLVFNRSFRFIPKIRRVVRIFAALDDWITSRPVLSHAGLQVIGIAEKPLSGGLSSSLVTGKG